MPTNLPLRADKGERGSSIVEFALLSPLLVTLFLGTWFFGYSYYLYAELEEAVRAGARYASVTVYDATNTTSYQSAVQNVVVYGDPSGGTQPLIPNLATTNVTVSISPTAGAPTSVAVSISGYPVPGMLGTVSLTGKPTLQMPFLGKYLP